MNKYTIWFRSVPGMYEQYVTKATVYADDEKTAKDKAYCVIRRDFPNRNRPMWRIDTIEVQCADDDEPMCTDMSCNGCKDCDPLEDF